MFLKFFSKIFCFNENYCNFAPLIRAKGPVFCYKIKGIHIYTPLLSGGNWLYRCVFLSFYSNNCAFFSRQSSHPPKKY